uniref:Uncharacterized protein n=1 Tax=Anguilla anguilla TaxID=7936 RepID=A0A0E9UJS1_ANGAN
MLKYKIKRKVIMSSLHRSLKSSTSSASAINFTKGFY